MEHKRSIEKIEQSAVKLTVTIPDSEVRGAYDSLLQKYGRTAQIKGFRKGKVPRDVLERKFGEAFRVETLQELIESSISQAIEEIDEKPLPYSRPELLDENLDLDPEKELVFSVKYDVFPEITVGEYTGFEIEEPQVKITKADETRELDRLREQNALVIDKEEGAAEEGDIVTVSMDEVDENDAPLDGTHQDEVVINIGHAHNLYHIDTEILGMNVGDTKTIEKEYPDDFEHEEIAGTSKRILVVCKQIKQRDVPELDDEFAQDINDDFETLEDLRKDVRKRLDDTAAARVRARKVEQLVEKVIAGASVEIPESMALAELESSWQQLSQQYRVAPEQLEQILTAQGSSKETVMAEWRPSAKERLRRSLVTSKLLELESIEVSDEDAEEQIREDARSRNADEEKILEYYKSQGMLSYVKQDISEKRLFDSLLERCTIKKGPKLSYVDVVEENS